jgi:hypothetical protein
MKQEYEIPYWWSYADKGSPKYSEKNESHCPLVCDKYHIYWLGIESRPPQWEAGESLQGFAQWSHRPSELKVVDCLGLHSHFIIMPRNRPLPATSCSLTPGSLVVILPDIWYVLHPQHGCHVTSISVNHTTHGLCDNGASTLNKTSRNAVTFWIRHK